MINSDDLTQSLRALAARTEADEAPLRVEAAVVRAFRDKHAARKFAWMWAAATAVAAAVLIAVAIGVISQPSRERERAVPSIIRPSNPQPTVAAAVPARAKPLRRRRPRPAVVAGRIEPQPVQFLPLLYGDDLRHIERGQVLRVSLPRTALAPLGIPLADDRPAAARISADVLLGEDGIARGIRFVSTDSGFDNRRRNIR